MFEAECDAAFAEGGVGAARRRSHGVYGRWEEFLGALIRHPQAATET